MSAYETSPPPAASPTFIDFDDSSLPIGERVESVLRQLTTEEKIALVHGDTQFTIPGVPRLGIPPFWFSDGPHGVREEMDAASWKPAGRTDDFATYLPVSIALAATWNPAVAYRFGRTIAAEARARGKDMMLGPGVNLQRTPLNGRNFEYYGEDPFLAGRIAVADIRGLQDGGVAACVKHFAANNQEADRFQLNVAVDERVLRELYLPAFEAAVKEGGVLGVMAAYNRINGEYCSRHELLLERILRTEWGFAGLVVSDWGAVHDTVGTMQHGLDVEMGLLPPRTEHFLDQPLRDALAAGAVSIAALDAKVRRILAVIFRVREQDGQKPAALNTREHQCVAREVADEAIVLLKNDHATLPLAPRALRSVAVIGENAVLRHGYGGNSSEVKALYEITPLEGIVARVGALANVVFAQGYGSLGSQKTKEFGGGLLPGGAVTEAEAWSSDHLLAQAVAAAGNADIAIVFAGLNHAEHGDSEGSDRRNLRLPGEQDELIAQVVAANPRTIVVLYAGAPLELDPWLDRVPAVLCAWYPGMEGGHAVAGVLFGDVNPSGKLPCTFPRRLADSAVHHTGEPLSYPGVERTVHYREGLLIGYRWHDACEIEPRFGFGHGLSYTRFGLAEVTAEENETGDVTVVCELDNRGDRAGAEVVQVYVEPQNSSVPRPLRELKGFVKVRLGPGEKRRVAIVLPPRAFAFYSLKCSGWVREAGDYVLRVGTSSRDFPRSVTWRAATTILLS